MGALLLILAGSLAGFMESHKLSVRVESLELFLQFLSAAKTEIRYSAVPVMQILQKHGGKLFCLRECVRRCANGDGFEKSWERSIGCCAKCDGFTACDRELLLSFGEEFGASDTEGQISHLELFIGLFRTNLESAREERDRKSKLYLMLGIFAGLAAALLLC